MVALAELIPYAIALVCLALAAIITVLVVSLFRWLIDLLNQIPTVDIGTGWLDTVEQSVTNALGTAFGWINKEVGASFHQLARFADWLWDELRGNGLLALELATGILPIAVAVRAVKSLIHHLTATNTAGAARVKTLEREYQGIEAKVKTLERDFSRGIGHDVLPRLKTLEREAARIENVQLPAAIAAQRQADSAISDLYSWAKGKASLLGVGTFTAAVATALSALGLDWLACRSRTGVNGKAGCALWNDIESLLGAAIVTGLALDLPALIGEAQKVTPGIIAGIEDLAGLGR